MSGLDHKRALSQTWELSCQPLKLLCSTEEGWCESENIHKGSEASYSRQTRHRWIPQALQGASQFSTFRSERFKSVGCLSIVPTKLQTKDQSISVNPLSQGLGPMYVNQLVDVFTFFSIFFFTIYDFPCLLFLCQFDKSCLNHSELVIEPFYQLWLWKCQMRVCLV